MAIKLFKLGEGFYRENADVNSGLTEVNLISEQLKQVYTEKQVLVILGGMPSQDDIEQVCYLISEADTKIFIASDIVSLRDDEQITIMNSCDAVLVQSSTYLFDGIRVPQFYSGVPELFYDFAKRHVNALSTKDDIVCFGGTERGRHESIERYCIYDSYGIYKHYVGTKRLSHPNYLYELSRCEYSLVVNKSKLYNVSSWVTARIFEVIACGVVPIIDYEYDWRDTLGLRSNFIELFVADFKEVKRVKNYLFSAHYKSELIAHIEKRVQRQEFLNRIKVLVGDTSDF